jgi:hypothetical protein
MPLSAGHQSLSWTTFPDYGDPLFQRLDIGPEFKGLRNWRTRRCGLIVQPFRAFRHRRVDCSAILRRDVRNCAYVLRLNAGPEPFDNAAQKDFLKGAFPSFA